MARNKEYTAEYDALLDREGKKIDNNNVAARINPYLKDKAEAANVDLQNELTTLRKQRQESVGAGRGEINPPSAYKKGGKIKHYPSAVAALKAAEKRGDKEFKVKFLNKKESKTMASKRGDGIAMRGHTKGRYL